jgi:hypothetical protein
MYNTKAISELNQDIFEYEIYRKFGHGTVESPYTNDKVIRILECSEVEAWIISESMNISIWGPANLRNGWEEPTFNYRKRYKTSMD